MQVVAKLHAILRPFILRRMKVDVEQLLPRKKEIILYASMTEHQKNFQDHLVNKTLEDYLRSKAHNGIFISIFSLISVLVICINLRPIFFAFHFLGSSFKRMYFGTTVP